MPELENLLQCDQMNIDTSMKNLTILEPRSTRLMESCILAITHVCQAYGKACRLDHHQQQFEGAIIKIPGFNSSLMETLHDAHLFGDSISDDPVLQAREASQAADCILSRLLLGLKFRRDLMFGLSDLLRLRLSSAMGILRTQVETMALLVHFVRNEADGRHWLETHDSAKGKLFHNKTRASISKIMRELGVDALYEHGSNMALHPRASGVAPGLLLAPVSLESHGQLSLSYQEIDSPEDLLFWICQFVRLHAKYIEAVPVAYPEVPQSIMEDPVITEFLDLEGEIYAKATPNRKRWASRQSGHP